MPREKLKASELVEILGIVDPFLMIDTLEFSSNGSTARGTKTISENDWFYKCHFVDDPVMPGVLQTEVMLQTFTAAVCEQSKTHAKDCLVNKISVNFLRKATGSGILIATVEFLSGDHGITTGKARLEFNGKKTCTASFRFVLPSQLTI
jgi:3-hydroxyacyl-[acyl-carrier-protein] dehydratase